MIPKIIHYIWFGGNPLTPLAEDCLKSWKQHMPEWEYMRWDESNFDISEAPKYVRQAYETRKYAFVSDYVRLWALEQYGGIYLDTDVKVLKSYEPLLDDIAFIGVEESKAHLPGTCVIGCEPHCIWVKDMLSLYENAEFVKPDGKLDLTTNVERMGMSMITAGLNQPNEDTNKPWKFIQYIPKWGLRVYPHDYFSPITSTRVMRKTKNTYSIHYFAESWRDTKKRSTWRTWVVTREIVNALVQLKRILVEHKF
ncbi:MAG: glycosyl transferase [Paludibacteraceae bacterium]|nr:glycosyl transferase [Paludibacteraceae bacterium]